MDKETLSNYGWIVICVLVLAVMIALASPFGSYVASAVENTTQGLFDVQQGALSAAGIDIADQSFENASGGDSQTPTEPETPTALTFTLDDAEYQFDEGMTWASWCESSYNTAPNSFYIRPDDEHSDGDRVVSDNVTSGDFKYIIWINYSSGSIAFDAVLPTDTITSQVYQTGAVTLPTATPTLITCLVVWNHQGFERTATVKAMSGTTWGEWLESDFNSSSFSTDGSYIYSDTGEQVYMSDNPTVPITPSDIMINNI